MIETIRIDLFDQETGEEMSWIEEKKRKLESNNKTADESNLTEKIKLLQKHQALQVKQRQNLLNLN